jgi:hypothetical protein
MVDVSFILNALPGPARMTPSQNSSTIPQPEKALTQEMGNHFRLFPHSHHPSLNLLIFVHANAAKGKSARIAFLSRTKVN